MGAGIKRGIGKNVNSTVIQHSRVLNEDSPGEVEINQDMGYRRRS
jgi:hypothetical protein